MDREAVSVAVSDFRPRSIISKAATAKLIPQTRFFSSLNLKSRQGFLPARI